jgi:hypothetical protein
MNLKLAICVAGVSSLSLVSPSIAEAQDTQTAVIGNSQYVVEFQYPTADLRTVTTRGVSLLGVSTDDAHITVIDPQTFTGIEGDGSLDFRQVLVGSAKGNGVLQLTASATFADTATGQVYELEATGKRTPNGILQVEITITPQDE